MYFSFSLLSAFVLATNVLRTGSSPSRAQDYGVVQEPLRAASAADPQPPVMSEAGALGTQNAEWVY